jgi:endoglucanase
MKEIIKRLVETNSPSGREEKIREVIIELIKDYVDDYRVDSLGNLIAHKKGGGIKILFDAHMDEIGFVASYIDDSGFVRIEPVGGITPQILPSTRIMFESGVIGTIWFEAEELDKRIENLKNLTFDNIYVDIGAKSREEGLSKISIGEMANFHREFVDYGNRLLSKAMDDRIGCSILIQVIRELKSSHNDLYFVFATQEEVGLVGARTACFSVEPQIGIAIDVTGTGFRDTPKGLKRIPMKLGDGPAIKIQDWSLVADKRINDYIVKLASELSIPYQYEILPYGGTDGGVIQTTKEGIPTSVISIPTRYLHSQSEIVDYIDVLNCVKLVKGIAERGMVI